MTAVLHEQSGFRLGQRPMVPEALEVGETFRMEPFELSVDWAKELLGVLQSIRGAPATFTPRVPASFGGLVGVVKSCLGAAWPDGSLHVKQRLIAETDLAIGVGYTATVVVRSRERRVKASDQFRVHLETTIASAEGHRPIAQHDMVSYWPSLGVVTC